MAERGGAMRFWITLIVVVAVVGIGVAGFLWLRSNGETQEPVDQTGPPQSAAQQASSVPEQQAPSAESDDESGSDVDLVTEPPDATEEEEEPVQT